MQVRLLGDDDRDELRSFLREDVWSNVYPLSILDWFGIAGPRACFWGAFADGELIGALAEAREAHCWYAAVAAAPARVVARLARELEPPRVALLLGREDLVAAALGMLPPWRRGPTTPMVFAVNDGAPRTLPLPEHPVRHATEADLPALVELYEGYAFDGYPTRRHLYCALADRIRWARIYVIERDGRPVAGYRVDASAAEVCLSGGLSTLPAYRDQRLGMSLRLAFLHEMAERGMRHCALQDPRNVLDRESPHRPQARWLIATLRRPAPRPWQTAVPRLRALVSWWDRPCARRPPEYLPEELDVAEDVASHRLAC